MQKSSIEWLDGGYTWNPIVGRCTPVSDGCRNCWHLRMAHRQASNPTLNREMRLARAGGAYYLDEQELLAPLKLRKASRIALMLMGDIMHPSLHPVWRCKVFRVMQQLPQCTFLLLTKRPDGYKSVAGLIEGQKHIWCGVSVEDQATADQRIPILLQIPAKVRFVSVEPLLDSIDLIRAWKKSPLAPESWSKSSVTFGNELHWCIVGAETGPHKRPCDPVWVDSLREQCLAAGVPFFGKTDSYGKSIEPREWPREV